MQRIITILQQKYPNQDFQALGFAALLHLTLFLFVCYNYQKTSFDQALSFTMISMDVSSSSNVVSSASVASGKNSKQNQKEKIEDVALNKSSNQDFEKLENKNSKSDQQVNAIEQNAVLAADRSASVDAANLGNKPPRYPELSRKLGEEGVVMVKVLVGTTGNAQSIELKKTSGFERLDKAAIETVRSWRFLAARQGGNFVSSWISIPIRFTLD